MFDLLLTAWNLVCQALGGSHSLFQSPSNFTFGSSFRILGWSPRTASYPRQVRTPTYVLLAPAAAVRTFDYWCACSEWGTSPRHLAEFWSQRARKPFVVRLHWSLTSNSANHRNWFWGPFSLFTVSRKPADLSCHSWCGCVRVFD